MHTIISHHAGFTHIMCMCMNHLDVMSVHDLLYSGNKPHAQIVHCYGFYCEAAMSVSSNAMGCASCFSEIVLPMIKVFN